MACQGRVVWVQLVVNKDKSINNVLGKSVDILTDQMAIGLLSSRLKYQTYNCLLVYILQVKGQLRRESKVKSQMEKAKLLKKKRNSQIKVL